MNIQHFNISFEEHGCESAVIRNVTRFVESSAGE